MADFDKEERIQEIKDAVDDFFEREGAKYQPFNEKDVAWAGYSVDTKFGGVRILFHAHSDQLIIKAMLPVNADEEERSNVGEFLLRANYGLKVGCFDFDFSDGEISYRISLFCGRDEFNPPTYEQINFAVIIALMMIEKYGNALVKVMFGVLEPEDAIASVEAEDTVEIDEPED